MKKIITLVALLSTGLLAACSMQPNSDEIKKAVQDKVSQENQSIHNVTGDLLGKSFNLKLESVEKIGDCIKNNDGKTYECDVKVVMDTPIVGKQTSTKRLSFIKGDNGWVLVSSDLVEKPAS
jgi:hypothetical protein